MNRREFLGSAGAFALTAGCASTAVSRRTAKTPQEGDIRSFLVHLGHNMWCDWYPEGFDTTNIGEGLPDRKLRCRDDYWRRTVDYIASKGMNQLVIDIGEGLVYPRRPELAIEGSWSAEKLATEVDRLKGLGLEVIPKLNFSTTHNGWLKQYRRMVGSETYYCVCEDVIRDACEIFGSPRLFHIGCDEEDGVWHVMKSPSRRYVVVRRDDVWKFDFLHLVRTCETCGARAWAWSDYGWIKPDFMKWCPKSVLLSNWFYDEAYGGFNPATNKTDDHCRIVQYWQLEEAGYDQVPCGTNWTGWKRKREGVGADDVIGKLVKTCRAVISKEHLKGFMMAPWSYLDTEKGVERNLRAADLFAAALGG